MIFHGLLWYNNNMKENELEFKVEKKDILSEILKKDFQNDFIDF